MGRFRRGLVLGSAGTMLVAGGLVWAGGAGAEATTSHASAQRAGLLGAEATTSHASAQRAGLLFHPMVRMLGATPTAAPPTEGWCLRKYRIFCYGVSQVETAYGLPTLYREGLNGHGETIVIVDSFGAPDIRPDLAVFDRAYGLTAPPHFTILKYGNVPAYTPATPTATGWAEETTLDVEWSHAMAPGANILLVETATAETVGLTGFPTIVNAENYVIDHHLGDVISQSFGAGEATFSAPGTILALQSAYENAYRNGITVLAAAGDTGVASSETVTHEHYFKFPDVGWPASDPLVTAVGGTQLILNPRGVRIRPDRVWNDTELFGYPAASSGGLSTVFTRPSYQDGVAGVVGSRRGVPDVSMSASVSGSVNIYFSGLAAGNGWNPIGGTSEASPLFSGIVAIADQLNGHQSLGLINPAIYAMDAAHDPGIVDVTAGTNTVYFTTAGKTITITGYPAGSGYNLATGVGTVTAPAFVHELVQTVHQVGTSATYSASPTSFLPVG